MKNISGGLISGLIGVAIFSGSLPATRVAVADFDPFFLTVARAALAGLISLGMIAALDPQRPGKRDLGSLTFVALGVVIGFPLLTALALQYMTSARSIVFIGLLPLATTLFAVLRAGEAPGFGFWVFSLIGSGLVVGYAFNLGADGSSRGDWLMLAAIAVCGFGYAEGAKLSRKLGGWQVICWALVLSLPIMLPLCLFLQPGHWGEIGVPAWIGFIYVSLFSMLIGFVFWYHGLAIGGIAAVGQLQLLQPFFGLALAAVLLGEAVNPAMILITLGVVMCIAGARRFF